MISYQLRLGCEPSIDPKPSFELKVKSFLKNHNSIYVEILFALVFNFSALFVVGFYLSYLLDTNISDYLNFKNYAVLISLYITFKGLFNEYFNTSNSNQLILFATIILVHTFAYTFISNPVERDIFYLVGPDFTPSKELINSIVFLYYILFNLMFLTLISILTVLKNILIKSPNFERLVKMTLLICSSSFLFLITLEGSKYMPQIIKGNGSLVQTIDFRDQLLCDSSFKYMSYKPNDYGFIINQTVVHGDETKHFHYITCAELNSAKLYLSSLRY